MKEAAVVLVLIAALIFAGCVSTNRYREVTIVEKYPTPSFWRDDLVKLSTGEIFPVMPFVFNEIEVNHTYIIKLGEIRSHTGIVGIEHTVEVQSLGVRV